AVDHLTRGLRQKPELLAPNVIAGIDYLKLGSGGKATPFLRRALKLDPQNQQARRALASSYLEAANFGEAAAEFRELAANDADKADAWFNLGHDYLQLAARLAYRGAHLYRDSPWGHRFLGDLLFERARWDEAIERYRNALRLDPKQAGLHTAMGETYLHGGNLAQAESEFRLELELDPKQESAWLGLAEVALSQGQVAAALTSVEKVWDISPEFLDMATDFPAIELAPPAADTLAILATAPDGAAKHFLEHALAPARGENEPVGGSASPVHRDFVQWQKSEAVAPHHNQDPCRAHRYRDCADFLKSRKPLSNRERLLLGNTLSVMREFQAASEVFASVNGVSSENAEASYRLARAYEALGAGAYARLEEDFPDSWRTHQLRAESYLLRRHPTDAVREFERAVEMRPQEPELHEALGELFLSEHSDQQGLSELQTALKLDSSRVHTLYLLGRFYEQNRETEKAVPYLEQALHLQPDSIEASSLLGTVYVHLGQFSSAIPQLQKAAHADHYGNVHYQLYQAYRKLGREELARKALAQSEELRRSSLARDVALIMGPSRGGEGAQ
ncbi:MAG: tetratricopeptide repeat protein, partial [Acidobacteria bacterium]|nr:tetratricopeptide repeat protein [Acidobacteriota bacterium]